MKLQAISAVVSIVAGLVYLGEVAGRIDLASAVKSPLESASRIAERVGVSLRKAQAEILAVAVVVAGALGVAAAAMIMVIAPYPRVRKAVRRLTLQRASSAYVYDAMFIMLSLPARRAAARRARRGAHVAPARSALALIRLASLLLSGESRDRYLAEWRGEIARVEGRWRQANFAVSLLLHAPHLAVILRRARRRKTTD